jgi:hypothetical protein
MTCIRDPWWDGTWIWSAPLIGLALIATPLVVVMWVFFIVNSAHLIAPLAVAWSNRGFRRVMIERRWKFIVLPITILIGTGLLGATVPARFTVNPVTMAVHLHSLADYRLPFVWLFPVYFIWNAWHFGMQNFGIVNLYRRARRRRLVKWTCIGATFAGMSVLPRALHSPIFALFALGLFSFQHSLAAIGISSHVLANHHARSPWLFAGALILAGAVGFWLMFCAPGFALRVTMTAVGLRIGLGFVHFLYDRWIWKLSDPQVRVTIGRDLFKQPQLRLVA